MIPRRLRSITGLYAKLLSMASRYAVVTLTLVAVLLSVIFWAYGQFGKGMIFFSDPDPKFANVTVRARGNLSADEINVLVQEVEGHILQVSGIAGINTHTMLTGGASRDGFDRIGRIFIELMDESQRDRKGAEIFREIRERTAPLAGISVEIQKMEQGPPVGQTRSDPVLFVSSGTAGAGGRQESGPTWTRCRRYSTSTTPGHSPESNGS